jgi:protein TonB
MLQRAALDAVRVARYRPYLLSGVPTEVQTTITVVFKLGS